MLRVADLSVLEYLRPLDNPALYVKTPEGVVIVAATILDVACPSETSR